MNKKYLLAVVVWYGLMALIGGSFLAWEWEIGYQVGFILPALILVAASLIEKE